MKYCVVRILQMLCVVSFTFLFAACEDKQLVQKNEQLRQQVSELEKENDLLQINAGEDPGDKSAEIKKLNLELEKTVTKIKELDEQREKLQQEHLAKEKEFRNYQKRYPVE